MINVVSTCNLLETAQSLRIAVRNRSFQTPDQKYSCMLAYICIVASCPLRSRMQAVHVYMHTRNIIIQMFNFFVLLNVINKCMRSDKAYKSEGIILTAGDIRDI